MDHLEEIRGRMSIEDLVGGYVQLKKSGRNLKGCCPFHNEKTPSFIVSPEKGIAYCFGCNKGGDIFKFIQLVENVEFKDAVKILANKTNVAIPATNNQEYNKRLQVIGLNQKVVQVFRDNLASSRHQYEYLKKRGLTQESIDRFQVGFALDHFHALKDALVQYGYSESLMLEAGLVNQRSMADQTSFDRFRGRIIFPIFDHQGNPVGFGGRIIGEGEPKYLNSPDTSAYNKSTVLYGLNEAKEAIKAANLAIVCEGYLDVIMAHQAGTKNVVATSGTALTPQQIKLLKRFTKNIAFAFDQDNAGLEATRRAIELSQESEVSIKVVVNPLGKDPADCVQENPSKWREACQKPISAMDFYFQYAYRKNDRTTLEGQKEILALLLPLIRLHRSQFEQNHYIRQLGIDLRVDPAILWADLKKIKSPQQPKSVSKEAAAPPVPKSFIREHFLLGFITTYPEKYPEISADLMMNIPFDIETETFYIACKKVYSASGLLDLQALKNELTDEQNEKMGIYRLLIDEYYPEFPEEMALREAKKMVLDINRANLKKIQQKVQFEIRESSDDESRMLLLNQYNEMLKLSAKLH